MLSQHDIEYTLQEAGLEVLSVLCSEDKNKKVRHMIVNLKTHQLDAHVPQEGLDERTNWNCHDINTRTTVKGELKNMIKHIIKDQTVKTNTFKEEDPKDYADKRSTVMTILHKPNATIFIYHSNPRIIHRPTTTGRTSKKASN